MAKYQWQDNCLRQLSINTLVSRMCGMYLGYKGGPSCVLLDKALPTYELLSWLLYNRMVGRSLWKGCNVTGVSYQTSKAWHNSF